MARALREDVRSERLTSRRISGKSPSRIPSQSVDKTQAVERWALCLVLLIVTAAVYSPVRSFPFINYDDPGYVAENLHVQAGLSWATLRWSLTATEQSNWHPLTWLSHALDCQLFGLDAGWHHLTSLVFHVMNVLLLFLLLQKATGAVGRSFLVAALFGLHPFNVDSVVWIAERKNLLSTFFLLLALAAYGLYTRRPSIKRYCLIAGLFILGLAAKPMLVTLPFALLLLDYWPLQRIEAWSQVSTVFPVKQLPIARVLTEKLPLLAIAVASCALTLGAQHGAIQPVEVLPLWARVENAVASYALYLWKTLWPATFAIHYPNAFDPTLNTRPGPGEWAALAGGVLLLIGVSWLAWWQRRERPYLLIGWLWYLGTLVPVVGIVQVGMQGMADRYAYVPLLGIFVILAWGLNELADKAHLRLVWKRAASAIVLTILCFLSYRQIGYWQSPFALWSHALAVTRNNVVANNFIGQILASEHRPEALRYFEEAARISPWDLDSHGALAAHFQDQGRLQDAIRNYEIVVQGSRVPQQLVFVYVNLSVIFGELGDFDRAREAYGRAWREDPRQVDAVFRNLATAVSLHPSDEGYLRLGLLLAQAGRFDQARSAYSHALQLNPNRVEAQRALSHLDAAGG